MGHIFRGGRWIIDLNDQDATSHLLSIVSISKDSHLVMNHLLYFLFIDIKELGNNEFAERHEDIKDGIIAIMQKKYDLGAKQLSTVIEGIVRKSLLKDGCCTEDGSGYLKWVSKVHHEHQKATNFYQILEGALIDPTSRIGRTIFYPPEQEIYLLSEMIRNRLAHGSKSSSKFDDYTILFFVLILLYHDLVNPHNNQGNLKYSEWIFRTRRNMRLKGDDPTLDKILEIAKDQSLDLAKIKEIFEGFEKHL